MIGQKTLVLASASRRRRELAAAFATPVELMAPSSEETERFTGEHPEEYVRRLSQVKAQEVAQQASESVVLGADTAVVLDDKILGKPKSVEEATRMLTQLRGRTHQVVTGVTVLDARSGIWRSSAKSTDVVMRHYGEAEIADYVASGEPFDKAGGYAIQDTSFRPAESIDGCYLNVVGLPMCEVVKLLVELGADIPLRPEWQPPSQCPQCPLQREEEGLGV